jgi:hypothetical protein
LRVTTRNLLKPDNNPLANVDVECSNSFFRSQTREQKRPVEDPRAGYFADSRENSRAPAVSCGPSVVMMEATEHGEGNDVALGRAVRRDGGQLVDPLVRARGVVVADVFGDDAVEVSAVEDENMVEAVATQGAQKALADGVHVGRAHGRADYPDPGGSRERVEGGPELVVAVANQESWRCTGGRRVTKLLRRPGLRWEPRRRREHNLAGRELDEHEREDRAEERVIGLQKVAGLDLLGVVP